MAHRPRLLNPAETHGGGRPLSDSAGHPASGVNTGTPAPATPPPARPCLAWHIFSSPWDPSDCLATAPQNRIRRSRPASALSAGGRQGALPCLDAAPRQPGTPCTSCPRNPALRDQQRFALPLSHGEHDTVLPPRKVLESRQGPYASRCRRYPDRSGEIGGPWLTTARGGAVWRCRSTGSDDGRIGHR